MKKYVRKNKILTNVAHKLPLCSVMKEQKFLSIFHFETFLNASIALTYLPYIIFALFGLGGNLLVCSAFGLIAQLISTSSSTSAAVYASHSFFDKLASGFYVFLTQRYISNYSYLLSYMPIYVLIVVMPFLICLKT